MKKIHNILLIVFLIAFVSSCSKFAPLEQAEKKGNNTMLKSINSNSSESNSTNNESVDSGNDTNLDVDVDVNITDTDSDEDYDKDAVKL